MAVDEIKKLLDQARQNQPAPTLAGAFWFERAKSAWIDKWRALVAKILGEN